MFLFTPQFLFTPIDSTKAWCWLVFYQFPHHYCGVLWYNWNHDHQGRWHHCCQSPSHVTWSACDWFRILALTLTLSETNNCISSSNLLTFLAVFFSVRSTYKGWLLADISMPLYTTYDFNLQKLTFLNHCVQVVAKLLVQGSEFPCTSSFNEVHYLFFALSWLVLFTPVHLSLKFLLMKYVICRLQSPFLKLISCSDVMSCIPFCRYESPLVTKVRMPLGESPITSSVAWSFPNWFSGKFKPQSDLCILFFPILVHQQNMMPLPVFPVGRTFNLLSNSYMQCSTLQLSIQASCSLYAHDFWVSSQF